MSRIIWFDFGLISTNIYFLGIFSPIMFLPAPLFYLAVRNISKGTNEFYKRDFIHFLPALLSLLDLLPFYLFSIEEKEQIVKLILSSPAKINFYITGIIPSIYVFSTRLVLTIIYFVFSLYYFLKSKRIRLLEHDGYKKWLYSTLIFIFTLKVLMILLSFSSYFIQLSNQEFPKVRKTLIVSILVIISIYIFSIYSTLNFSFIKNTQKKSLKKKNKPSVKSSSTLEVDPIPISSEEFESQTKLKELIETDLIYLNNSISAKELAKLLKINARELPALLQSVYGCTFKDLINRLRVKFAVKKIDDNFLDTQTIEALGQVSGFNSRITFFNAFKKEKGCSPNEYWKRYQDGEGMEYL
ncbi:helix-turn-helix domain-containing protein [Belliella marina]|uniref:Helix-turn-helix domain-containing protein n=1 Tax=Belliella marina TaxID=1644146 RepID=A0ABW4VRV0_9BACT